MRDVQRAMTKLYDAAIAAGLSADDATMAIGAMAGMTLPVDAEPIETEGETDGRTE